jgi:hypothetical protein
MLNKEWHDHAEKQSVMETSIKKAYTNGARHYKHRVTDLLSDKLKHLWNSTDETNRHTILILNEILTEINTLMP